VADLKPSEVVFRSFPFCLVDTLGKTELEIAAGIIVEYCKEHGDHWQRVTWQQIREFLRPQQEKLNPFAMPNFHGLAPLGLALWHDDDASIELTSKCLSLIQRPAAWKTELR
jgi:hypothetical protein